jgi:trehalose transport system permease protein
VKRPTIGRIALYVVAVVAAIIIAFPIYILLLLALVPPHYTLFSAHPPLIPPVLTLSTIETAISTPGFTGAFELSLEIAFMVGGLAILIGIPTAYGLSRLGPRIAYTLTTILFIVNMLPSITIAIPLTVPFIKLGLYGSPISIALAQELLALPITTFLLLGAFQSLPREIEQSARVDGANGVTAIYGVLVPLIAPAIVASFLLSWMLSWDESTFALILSNLNPPTLPVLIFLSATGRGNPTLAVAFSLIATIPVIVLTVLLQKYLRGEDLAAGIRG